MNTIIDNYLIRILEQESKEKNFTPEEAKKVGDEIGVDWTKHSLENFVIGLNIEREHGNKDLQTNVTNDDPIITGKIAYAHMKEVPGTGIGKGNDYYALLKKYVEND